MAEIALMNIKSAARYLGCSVSLLRLWKRNGCGPRFFQHRGVVRYRPEDLDRFILENLHGGSKPLAQRSTREEA